MANVAFIMRLRIFYVKQIFTNSQSAA